MRRLALLLCLAAWAAPAAAQTTGAQEKAAAEALFREGRDLLAEGQVAAACAKLDESLRLDRSPGTLLNLADCHERDGRTASAWAEFLEAARMAEDSGWQAGAEEAKRRAASLEDGLSRLTVRVSEPVEGLALSLDGTSIAPAALGTALPADPGEHAIRAEAPGREPWTTTITLAAGGAHQEVVVPALSVASDAEAEPASAGQREPSQDTLGAVETDDGLAAPDDSGSALPYVFGAVGVAGIAAGAVLGLLAKGKYDDAETACPSHRGCDQDALDDADDAELRANLSNVGFGVGVVALGVAAVLWLTGGESEGQASAPTLRAVVGPGTAFASASARF